MMLWFNQGVITAYLPNSVFSYVVNYVLEDEYHFVLLSALYAGIWSKYSNNR